MRATIRFEVDVDRVQQTMGALVWEELQPLHQAMDVLETSKPHDLHDGIGEALEILGAVATQLEQYRDMIASFEKARFETKLPQPVAEDGDLISAAMGDLKQTTADMSQIVTDAEDLRTTTQSVDQFGSFLDKLNEFAGGEPDDSEPKEG